MAGARSYVLTGDGFGLHNAILRYAFDFMTLKHGFKAMSVPVLVKEECMVGTSFFPSGREQAYHIEESKRGGGYDQFLTRTGEVGLMGLHQDEILDEAQLPLKYTTVSTCFRREAGAAGKDTAGLYRIHQFDKVEQVVICKADEQESRRWHKQMIGYVEELLQSLGLPYRLLQCCTGDLGVKNADMIDIESWMPGRGEMSGGTGGSSARVPLTREPLFVPHLLPLERGIIETIYAEPASATLDTKAVQACLRARYDTEPFVTVRDDSPTLRDVQRTNMVHLNARVVGGRVVIVGAEDNLGKGASGQAVQNANLMLGVEETEGL